MKESYFREIVNSSGEDKEKLETIERPRQEEVEQEQNKRIVTAQRVFENEFDISPLESEKALEKKVGEVIESTSFLEKIRSNSLLRNALKTMVVIFSLMRAESAFGQTKTEVEEKEKVRIEYVQQEKNTYENNRRLIGKGEHVVPEKVMVVFGEVVDPGMIGTPAGGYFKKNYLNSRERQNMFFEKMGKLGYSKKETQVFVSYFENGNVVFNENELQKEHFRDVLAHERLHKKIDNLPAEQKIVLNEARDFILKDFREKELRWSQETDSLFNLFQKGEINQYEYKKKSMDAMIKADSILLDAEGETEGLIPVLINREEFYTYLMMNKFQPSVVEYIQLHFPQSFQIFENLKNGIQQQIQEQEKK
jgi:hypothetical protein